MGSDQHDESDASLVARMKRGDRTALATLYEQHAPRLLVLAQRMLGSRNEAEDLLHDVFVEAWRRVEDYSEERGSVGTWLSLRTRSRAIDSDGRTRAHAAGSLPRHSCAIVLIRPPTRLVILIMAGFVRHSNVCRATSSK